MRESVIVSAVRTPTGKFLGGLKDFTATELGALVVREAVRARRHRPGHVSTSASWATSSAPAPGQAPGAAGRAERRTPQRRRRADDQQGVRLRPQGRDARRAGHRDRRHRHRGRGRHGVDEQLPVPAAKAREGLRMGHGKVDRLDDPRRPVGLLRELPHGHDGRARGGEVQGHARGAGRVSRPTATARPPHATGDGAFKAEILPVSIPQKKGDPIVVDADESIRDDTTVESLGRAEAGVQEGRHGHRRQRARRQRRRRGAGRDGRRRGGAG